MTPLTYILIGIVSVLAIFLILPFLGRRGYSVIKRLGTVQLASNLNTIRISTAIIKKPGRNSPHVKGLFVLGTVRGGMHAMESEAIFPITEREIDEVLALLKSQPVFSVTWQKQSPIILSIDGSAQEAKLIFKKTSFMDLSFVSSLDDASITRLRNIFESLKKETDFAQISA